MPAAAVVTTQVVDVAPKPNDAAPTRPDAPAPAPPPQVIVVRAAPPPPPVVVEAPPVNAPIERIWGTWEIDGGADSFRFFRNGKFVRLNG